MRIKNLIWVFVLLLSFGIVNAATTVNLDPEGNLADSGYSTSSTITYGFNVTGNQSTWNCKLFTSTSGSWTEIETDSSVTNSTNTDFNTKEVNDSVGTSYIWNVFCNGTTDKTGAWATNYTFGVDTTSPVVTINFPTSNGAWYSTNTYPRIGLTVLENNPNTCILGTNLNVSSNNTGVYDTSFETYSYSNNTAFNFSGINSSNAWADNNTGAYIWTYSCTDDAGNTVSLGSNYTFYIDTIAPGNFALNSTYSTLNGLTLNNDSTATDYTPRIGWNTSSDTNFSHYEITFFKDSYGDYNSTTDVQKNITSSATLYTDMSTLVEDTSYLILVTAFDLAGNNRNMSIINYKYTTDSTSRALYTGWNIIMNTGNQMNLSDILSYSGASQVSYYNTSHSFVTQVSGGSNGGTNVPYGEPAYIYMSSSDTFDDWIVNTSAGGTKFNITANLTSDIKSNWSIACDRNTTETINFQKLDYYLNGNKTDVLYNYVNWFDLYNNSASVGHKFIPFVNNWTINNATPMVYGDCGWFHIDCTKLTAGYKEIDWLSITG